MPASPNSFSLQRLVAGPRPGPAPVADGVDLPSAKPPAVRFVAAPQHGGLLLPTSQAPEVTHRRSVSTGVSAAPPSKS